MPRLLVVDDEPSIRDLICECFSAKGYDVATAATGAEGLPRLREDRAHVVLLDLLLPEMDGVKVLGEAKAIDPGVSVVMLTGVLDEAIGRQALREGAFDYVTKPVDLNHLERLVWYKLTTMTLGWGPPAAPPPRGTAHSRRPPGSRLV